MTTWSKEELRKIADADDLHISPFREDGVTYGTPTWIWSVAVPSRRYVRDYNGRYSRSYTSRITAAGMKQRVFYSRGLRDDLLKEIAQRKQSTPGQIALAPNQ